MRRYRKRYMPMAAIVALCATSGAADAGPSAQRIKDGPGLLQELLGDPVHGAGAADTGIDNSPAPQQPAGGHSRFDGIWQADGNRLLLIKQIHRTLYLSGSDPHSAWQAQCVPSRDQARCIGSGISSRDGAFEYTATLHMQGGALSSDWQRSCDSGRKQSGQSRLRPR